MGATGRGHGFESLAERRALTVLDFCGQVRDVLSQPFRLRFLNGTRRAHIPDFLVATAGATLLIDVRPAHLVKESDVAVFAATGRVAASAGWRYLVVTGWRNNVADTVEALARGRRRHTDPLGLEDQLLGAAVRPRRFGELVAATSWPVLARDHLQRLLWKRRLAFDLNGAARGWHLDLPGGAMMADAGARTPLIEELTEQDLARLHIRLEHLMEVETGFRSGSRHWARPDEPRPAFDPATTSLGERRLAKVAELGALPETEAARLGLESVSERTLKRMATRYRKFGLIGLADGRWTRQAGGHPSVTADVEEAIRKRTRRGLWQRWSTCSPRGSSPCGKTGAWTSTLRPGIPRAGTARTPPSPPQQPATASPWRSRRPSCTTSCCRCNSRRSTPGEE